MESKHTIYVQNIFFFEDRVVYEITWKNNVERGRPQIAVWRMLIACWIPKATNTHSVCVIFIAFPLQQLLHKCASVLFLRILPVLFNFQKAKKIIQYKNISANDIYVKVCR
jgi:hypothetical protein